MRSKSTPNTTRHGIGKKWLLGMAAVVVLALSQIALAFLLADNIEPEVQVQMQAPADNIEPEVQVQIQAPPTRCMVCGGEVPLRVKEEICGVCSDGQYVYDLNCKLCPESVPTDPCSSAEDVESWLVLKGGKFGVSKYNPVCPRAVRNRIHVVLPFYNLDRQTISAALHSVQGQDYPLDRMTIWMFDDASDAEGSEKLLRDACGTNSSFVPFVPPKEDLGDVNDRLHASRALEGVVSSTICIRSKEHLGPAGGKYWAFMLVHALAEPNDVIVVVDGDDELRTPHALQVINEKYINDGVWCTYGSHEGKYSDQTQPLPKATVNGTDTFDPRNEQPSWRFGHPRTFKAHLLRQMDRQDFTSRDGSWLLKATDRGYVYRMLELSGADRAGYIPQQIYKYKFSKTASTLSTVKKKTRDAHLQHIQSLLPSSRLELPIHVAILCWDRVFLLKDQLVWLQEQTGLNGRQLHLHILNNNIEEQHHIDEMVSNFTHWQQSTTAGLGPGVVPIKITTIHNKENWHAFSRFLYVDELRRKEPLDYILFVDDDQYWDPTFASSLLAEHKPKGMTSWYGKTFDDQRRNASVTADYWGSDVQYSDIIAGRLSDVVLFTYGGPGGSIFDANLWLLGTQLLRLKDDLSRFYKFDDIWSSYVIDALLGWEIRRLLKPVPIDVAKIRLRSFQNIVSQIPAKSQARLLELSDSTLKAVASAATFSKSTEDKSDMFKQMQTTFRWDVTRLQVA